MISTSLCWVFYGQRYQDLADSYPVASNDQKEKKKKTKSGGNWFVQEKYQKLQKGKHRCLLVLLLLFLMLLFVFAVDCPAGTLPGPSGGGGPWSPPGRSWVALGVLSAPLGGSCGSLAFGARTLLIGSWPLLGASWAALGGSWASLGPPRGALEGS